MVEAVCDGVPLDFDYGFERESLIEEPSSELFELELEDDLLRVIQFSMGDERVAELIYQELLAQGLGGYEKHLGSGAFGSVFQIAGAGAFEGKKLALKLIPQIPNWWFWSGDSPSSDEPTWSYSKATALDERMSELYSERVTSGLESHFLGTWGYSLVTEGGIIGDGLALNFPKEGGLSAAYGALLYDGERVQYVESIDLDLHKGYVILGVVCLAAEEGNLYQRVQKLPLDSEAVKGYGKSLAHALHELHGLGYIHRDLHMGNVLVMSPDSYDLKLTDFGLTVKMSERFLVQEDWYDFGWVLKDMSEKSSIKDPRLDDLLYHEEKGLLSGEQCYSELEILNHPYFV